MTEPLRILSVNAHPHDFTHTAGTLGIHTARGDSATVVSVTAGTQTHNERLHDELMKPVEEQDPAIVNQPEGEIAAGKEKELRQACAVFGVSDVRVLGFPQPFRFADYPEAADRIAEVILDVRPHVLIMQSPYTRAHQGRSGVTADDHTETALATIEAKGEANRPRAGVRPHSIATTLFPGVYFERTDHDFVVDISDWFEQRVEAETCYVSQGHTRSGRADGCSSCSAIPAGSAAPSTPRASSASAPSSCLRYRCPSSPSAGPRSRWRRDTTAWSARRARTSDAAQEATLAGGTRHTAVPVERGLCITLSLDGRGLG